MNFVAGRVSIDQDVSEVVDPRFAADHADVGVGVGVGQRLAAAAAEQSRVRDHVAAARASRAQRHARIADDSSRKLIKDLRESGIQDPVVFVTHRDFPLFGAWTYFPLLPRKLKLFIALIIVNDYNVNLQLEHIRR